MNKILVILSSAIVLLFGTSSIAGPRTISDYYNATVRVLNLEQNSGGTGSILRSFNNASHILTNKHVCKLVEQGGYVNYKGKNYIVTHYKKYKQHDLCLVRIATNLKINLKVSSTLISKSQKVLVSGHPNLLPHILTQGHTSDNLEINLVIGMKKCTKAEALNDQGCVFFGGKAVVKSFDSQVVSNLIKPGSSGSAVYNTRGEIVGVVFAGSGRGFSHGFIVPHIYVLYFIQNAHRFDWVKVGTPVDDGGLSGRIFNYNRCTMLNYKSGNKKLKRFCSSIKDNSLWRK